MWDLEDQLEVEDLKKVVIYTDGAAVPNPGAGGYGVVLRFGKHCKELSGGFALTTNNRMEMMAVIVGLEALKEPCKVDLYTDSKYVMDPIEKGWVYNWRKKGWKRKKNGTVKNLDLWKRPFNDLRQARRNPPLGQRTRWNRRQRAL